ncbi:pmp6, partial [Symbiodinium necroappetens]
MALSFFTSAQLAIGALPVSSRFREAEGSIPGLSSFGSLLERAVEDSPLSTQSVDCILGREVRLKDQVQWQLIVPALGVASVFFFAVAGDCCAQDARPLRHRILRFALVWSNQFAPVLAAASASCLPCVSIAEGKAYAAFDPDIQCPNALPTLSMLKWAGMLGGVSLLVPLWWIWLARDLAWSRNLKVK